MTSLDLGEPDSSYDSVGYYGLPVIHGPHWKWLIVLYFFFGGISGSSAVLSAIARLTEREDGLRISRVASYVSMTALLPCPIFLVLDLGRPTRFLNMLRVLRPSSPMSMGSWGLALFGAATSLSTLLQVLIDLQMSRESNIVSHLDRPARQLAPLSALLGLIVAGYTGVLLAATAVPIWSKRPWLLGPLFLTSATSSGAAAVAIATSLVYQSIEAGEAKLHRFGAYAMIAESAILTGWIYALGPTAKPVVSGHVGSVMRHVVVGAGMVVPQLLAIGSLRSQNQRNRLLLTRATSVLTLVGGLALRYAVVQAGRDSATDPQATFDMTRG